MTSRERLMKINQLERELAYLKGGVPTPKSMYPYKSGPEMVPSVDEKPTTIIMDGTGRLWRVVD